MPKKQLIVNSIGEIGQFVRDKRKQNAFTQIEAALFCNVGTRFFSDLENGKETLQIGKVLHVLKAFGIVLEISERGLPPSSKDES